MNTSPDFGPGMQGNSNYPKFEGDKKEPGAFTGPEKAGMRRKPGDATQLVDQILDTTRGLSGVVASEAKDIAGRVSQELSASAEAGVARGADALSSLVRAMQGARREIEDEAPGLARNIDRAAEQVENFADSIRGRSVSELFASAADLAKRHPTTFLAGAILAGFGVSRFLRSGHAADNTNPDIAGDTTDTRVSAS